MTSTSVPLISLDGLKMALATTTGTKPVIKNSEIELAPHSSAGLVGESGSGKSLTVGAILGLIPFLPGVTGGRLRLAYNDTIKDVWHDGPWLDSGARGRNEYFSWQRRVNSRMKPYRGRRISIIFQRAKASLNPFLKIKDQIFESLEMASEQKDHDRMLGWLRDCGFNIAEAKQVAEQYPHQLSGGQAQRAVMAVTLASQAETIIADEPTTGLDVKLQVEALLFMKKLLDKYGKSAVIISHNLQSLAKFTDTCFVMYKGLTIEKGPTPKILSAGGNNHPYTRKLQGEVESATQVGKVLTAEVAGCPYYSNCEIYALMPGARRARCREHEPPKVWIENDHFVRCWAFEK
jgi:ABC-type dipeptide/oligopeptide/nickel transport system ATPase component